MAIAVANTTTIGFGSSPRAVSNPSVLEGEVLVAVVVGNGTIATPAGWTSRVNELNQIRVVILEKVADASDEAASTFSFTGTNNLSVTLMRVTGTPADGGFDAARSTAEDGGDGSVTITTLTPAYNNSLLILVRANQNTADGTSISFSGYTINGTNPTWTEQSDISADTGANQDSYGVATAIQATAAAITTLTIPISPALNFDDVYAIAVYTPRIDASATFTKLNVSPTLRSLSGSSGVMATFTKLNVSPTLRIPTGRVTNPLWQDQEKPTGETWTNEEKPT